MRDCRLQRCRRPRKAARPARASGAANRRRTCRRQSGRRCSRPTPRRFHPPSARSRRNHSTRSRSTLVSAAPRTGTLPSTVCPPPS
jgi:hypothetical protein